MPKPRPEPFSDERQPILFDDLPLPPPLRSDRRALADLEELVGELVAAKTNPWSIRQHGWQLRRFDAFAAKLTPIEAAIWRAKWDAELDRVGPPVDVWAETAGELN